MDYYLHLAILIGIYSILAQSLNLSFGLGRSFNLAHIANYALGAYATALLSTEHGFGLLPCLAASALVSGGLAFALGGIANRISEEYFAIGTLAFSSVISALLINWKGLTHGVFGVPGIPRPGLFGLELYDNADFFLLTLFIVAICQILLFLLFRNSFSRMLRSQGERELAAKSLGYNTSAIRTTGFFISSSLAGIAGALYAYYMSYIDPTTFGFQEMIFVLTIVVLGRPGSFWGCLGAAAFLVLLPEPLRYIELSPATLGPMRQLMYAFILFSVVYLNRAKLFPVERRI